MSQDRASRPGRLFKNLLIAPNRQLRLIVVAVTMTFAVIFTFFAFEIWIFSSLFENIASLVPESAKIGPAVAETIHSAWLGFGFGALSCVLVVAFAITMISHRVYGPMVVIRKHIAAILSGDYEYRTRLRKNDELAEVADDLNRLAEKLSERAST